MCRRVLTSCRCVRVCVCLSVCLSLCARWFQRRRSRCAPFQATSTTFNFPAWQDNTTAGDWLYCAHSASTADHRPAVVSTLGRRRLMESKTAPAWQSASESRHFALSRSTITVRQTGRLIGSEVTTLWRYTNLFIIIIIIFLTLGRYIPEGV